MQLGQTKAGQAGAAGNPDLVADFGAVAAQRPTRFDFANGGNTEVEWASGGIATDQVNAVFGGAGEEAFSKFGNPRFIGCWERAGQRDPARLGAHRGEVGKIDGQRLPAQIFRIGIGQKMRAGDQHVGRDGELLARCRLHQGAVVTGAEYSGGGRPGEVFVDQRKLAGHRFSGPASWPRTLPGEPAPRLCRARH